MATLALVGGVPLTLLFAFWLRRRLVRLIVVATPPDSAASVADGTGSFSSRTGRNTAAGSIVDKKSSSSGSGTSCDQQNSSQGSNKTTSSSGGESRVDPIGSGKPLVRESQRAGSLTRQLRVKEIHDALTRAGDTYIVDDAEEFELVEVLGLGTFGQAELRKTPGAGGNSDASFVVIKRVPLQKLSEWSVGALVGEVTNGAAMRHRHIVQLHGAYTSRRNELCMVLQCAPAFLCLRCRSWGSSRLAGSRSRRPAARRPRPPLLPPAPCWYLLTDLLTV